jgi:hypothetical protein
MVTCFRFKIFVNSDIKRAKLKFEKSSLKREI